ncbi:hypothetical protein RJ55_02524 [Drechmeria coniospora]|nr:hypothetical protein RJ55_02524 [Drechmeria coniospora]
MWDRLQATSSATATATFFAFGRHRHQTSSPSHSDHTAGIPKSRTGRRRGNHGSSWPDNLDDPFGTLAVARSGSYKFEISRGKVVPQTTHADM